MSPAGCSRVNVSPASLADPSPSASRKGFKLARRTRHGFSGSHEELETQASPRVDKTSAEACNGVPQLSATKTFFRRTVARFRRKPKQPQQLERRFSLQSKRSKESAGGEARPSTLNRPPYLGKRSSFASITRLVLRSTDDVAFSPSAFFRRVDEVRSLSAASEAPSDSAPPRPPPSVRRPPRPPRRRPPPPVDDVCVETDEAAPPTKSPADLPPKLRTSPRNSLARASFDSLLELQTLAVEIANLGPLDSPPLAQHGLRASPSIKLTHTRSQDLHGPQRTSASAPRDPLSELLAVADELKTMKNLDSDDILYLTDPPPFSPLPPALHAFLGAPAAAMQILEMDVHGEDELFYGEPIPCIVVTSEDRDTPRSPQADISLPLVPPSSPSESLLAPPPTTHRGRIDVDRPLLALPDDWDYATSPSEVYDEDEDADTGGPGGSPSLPCDCTDCTSSDLDLSWEAVSASLSQPGSPSATPASAGGKPDPPTVPKPAPLLRRRERSLLQRVLGGRSGDDAPPKDKVLSRAASKQKQRKRISKEIIGPPRPLSPTSQAAFFPQPCAI
ncbi:hypothetical protein BC834DRAFT_967377 [Gloeopeniophorella convolvens]|nr:hypothetical protein BC834DRAFT_967377 [Gloeopeniophorella convolvens]